MFGLFAALMVVSNFLCIITVIPSTTILYEKELEQLNQGITKIIQPYKDAYFQKLPLLLYKFSKIIVFFLTISGIFSLYIRYRNKSPPLTVFWSKVFTGIRFLHNLFFQSMSRLKFYKSKQSDLKFLYFKYYKNAIFDIVIRL